MTMIPQNRGQAAIDPLFVTTGIVVLLSTIIGAVVYRQVANIPARDYEYVCNSTMGCTGEPGIVGPVVLALVAAAVIGVVYRSRNSRADEGE